MSKTLKRQSIMCFRFDELSVSRISKLPTVVKWTTQYRRIIVWLRVTKCRLTSNDMHLFVRKFIFSSVLLICSSPRRTIETLSTKLMTFWMSSPSISANGSVRKSFPENKFLQSNAWESHWILCSLTIYWCHFFFGSQAAVAIQKENDIMKLKKMMTTIDQSIWKTAGYSNRYEFYKHELFLLYWSFGWWEISLFLGPNIWTTICILQLILFLVDNTEYCEINEKNDYDSLTVSQIIIRSCYYFWR